MDASIKGLSPVVLNELRCVPTALLGVLFPISKQTLPVSDVSQKVEATVYTVGGTHLCTPLAK